MSKTMVTGTGTGNKTGIKTKTITTTQYLQDTALTQKSYHIFINSLNSNMTKSKYHRVLFQFLSSHKFSIERTDEFLNLPTKEIESMIIDDITRMQQKEKLSVSTVQIMAAAIQHLCAMNDVVLNWKKIRRFIRTDVPKHRDEAYTHDDVKKLLEISDLRMKTVFLVLASTGIRIDALHDIKLKNLTKIDNDNIYKIIIYQGFKEEYFVFATPECTAIIDSYLDYRRRSGELLNDNSYLIREAFDNNDIRQVKELSRKVSTSTLRKIIQNHLIKAGIREHNNSGYDNRLRHSKAQVHGFRKFVTTQLVNSKVNPEIRELLLGHHIGLTSAYYRPSENDMLDEYLKAVDNLTINEENRLKRKVEKLEVEKSLMDQLRAEVISIKQEMAKKYKEN